MLFKKTFLKLIPPIVTFIYNDTVVHVQIRLQARNTELINLVLGVITNTEAPIHGNVEGNHWLLGKLWGYPELAQNDEVISQIFWLVWGHVCLDTSMLHTWKFNIYFPLALKQVTDTSVWDISVCCPVSSVYCPVFAYLKVQALNLHLYENKSLNLDTSVYCWESPHLKINLKVNESVPSFFFIFLYLLIYQCFYNFFAVLCSI